MRCLQDLPADPEKSGLQKDEEYTGMSFNDYREYQRKRLEKGKPAPSVFGNSRLSHTASIIGIKNEILGDTIPG